MVKFCRNCGAEIPAEGKFCGVCGTPVAVQPEAEVEQVPVVAEEPVIPAISMDDEPAEIVVEPAQTEIEPMEVADPEPLVLPQDETPVEKKEKGKKVKAPKEKPPVGKGILNRRGAFRSILAVLLCIVIFVGSFAALTIWNVWSAVFGGNQQAVVATAITGIDIMEIPTSMVIAGNGNNGNLGEWMAESISAALPEENKISESELEEFMEESNFAQFLSLQLANYACDVLYGTETFAMDSKTVETLLKEDSDLIEDITGIELTAEGISAIASQVEGFMNESLTAPEDIALSADLPVQTVVQIANGAITGTFMLVLAVFVLTVILVCIILGAINRSSLRTCSDIGVTFMVAGGIWGIVGLFPMILPDLWADLTASASAVTELLAAILERTLIPSAVVFGTGFVLVLIKVIGKPIAKAVAKKAKNK